MEEKKKKGTGCCSCEAGFKEEIRNMEEEARKPSMEERDKKKRELDQAFQEKKKK